MRVLWIKLADGHQIQIISHLVLKNLGGVLFDEVILIVSQVTVIFVYPALVVGKAELIECPGSKNGHSCQSKNMNDDLVGFGAKLQRFPRTKKALFILIINNFL